MDSLSKIFRGDRVIWMIFLFLCLISIVEVFSASSTLAYKNNYWDPILQHTTYLLIGLAVILICHAIEPKIFACVIFLLPVSILMLVITKLWGTNINDADRWLTIGGVTIQSSEIAIVDQLAACSPILKSQSENGCDTCL